MRPDTKCPEVMCIGSAVMDITAEPISRDIPWQEKQRIRSIRMGVGGDAANQAVHLADLGIHAGLCGCIGEDENGRFLEERLQERGVMTQYLVRRRDLATGTALVLLDDAGERSAFSAGGAHYAVSRRDCETWENLPVRAISLASLFSMPELEKDGMKELLVNMGKRKILVFADLASDKEGKGLKGIEAFLPFIDYFLPSLYDVKKLTGCGNAAEGAGVLQALGCRNVIIKCGAEGCYVRSGDTGLQVPALPVDPVDTTGAGDCMSALFIAGILEGWDVFESAAYAAKGASVSTLFMGACKEKITRERIREYLQAAAPGTP